MPFDRLPPPAASDTADLRTLQAISAVGGAAHVLTAAALWFAPPAGISPSALGWVIGPCIAIGLLFAGAVWAVARWPARTILLTLAWLSCASIVNVAAGEGRGVQSLDLGFFGLIVCIITVWLGARPGALLAAACTASLAALAFGAQGPRLLPALLTQLMLLGCSLGIGLIVSGAVRRAANRVEHREQRLRGLLDISADRYWEMDADLRFTDTGWLHPTNSGPHMPYLGRHPWELSDVIMEPAALAAHAADLKAHRPFRDLRVARRAKDGRMRHYAVSGSPRFHADGRFRGYWGIDRNVTTEVDAQQTVAASEQRFRDLFKLAPSPLLLHRGGRVFDANPAAAAMFGFDTPAAMGGTEIESLCVDPESLRRVRERSAWMERQPIGSTVPTADLHMRPVRGQPLTTQASAVRVNAEGGPATLSIFVDITARVRSEAALRESQRMLETLFANHPDGIALTVMDTGRYVIVNENFGRILGYRVDEVIGRTSTDIGLWTDPQQRARLLAELIANGRLPDTAGQARTRSGRQLSVTWSSTRVEINGRAHLVSTLRDVTEDERLRLEHSAVFDSAIVGIALTRDQHFQLANPRFHEIFGYPGGALVGQPALSVWPDAATYAEVRGTGMPVLQQGLPLRIERPMKRADGSVFWCRMQAQVVDPANPLHGGTVWVVEDITEQRLLDDKLAAARDAAEAASRAKSSFLANTSHEIRTPLNGMLGLARMAMRDDLTPALRRLYLGQLVDSAQSLAAIITDILDLSKIEAGRIEVESAPFDLHQLLNTLHATYRPTAAANGLAFALEIDDAVPGSVVGDAMRVRQILANFVTNALKFTPDGDVRLSARALGDGRLRLAVSDSGPGIAADLQPRLFTPFTQGDDSTTRQHGGTGLGLSICRELARLLGGTVGVDSRPGRGSEFWCELPLTPAEPLADAAAAARTDVSPRATAQPELEAPGALAGLRVLVVEDNAVNMMVVVAMLGQWGAEASEAADGALAISAVDDAAAAGRPFDIVLMDVQMPRMSGHDATRRLRQRWSAAALPIVALTAAALIAEREEALAAGMNDFLTKPIDAAKLFEALKRLALRRATR